MLHTLSWPQFFSAAGVFTGLWCLVIAVLYYRKELHGLINGKDQSEEEAWRQEIESEQEELMGKAKEPEGLETVSMHELQFAPEKPDESLGLVPDVLEELKYIFYTLVQTQGGKAGFMELFSEIAAKYAQIKNKTAINNYIREQVDFEISDEELEGLCK